MDVISHGIWGGMLLSKRTPFRLTVVFGMLPDALAFVPYLIPRILAKDYSAILAMPQNYPPWVFIIYNCTHSLVIAGIVFYVLCRIRLDWGLSFLAWPLHILFDIPTHTAASFPTKFLFPLSHLHCNGISWRTGYIFLGNWLAIALLYLFLAVRLQIARQQ